MLWNNQDSQDQVGLSETRLPLFNSAAPTHTHTGNKSDCVTHCAKQCSLVLSYFTQTPLVRLRGEVGDCRRPL